MCFGRPADEPAAAEPAERGQGDVVVDGHVHDQALLAAVLGDEAHARPPSTTWAIPGGMTAPLSTTLPASRSSMPKIALATSLRPAPIRPERATISPGPDAEGDVGEDALAGQVLDPQYLGAEAHPGLGEQRADVATRPWRG